MKKLILLIAATFAAATAFSQTSTGAVWLVWDAPTNAPDVYKLYHSTSLSVPLTNWEHIATAPGNVTTAQAFVQPGQHFFFLTASNAWGETLPSNVAGTAPLAEKPTVRLTWYGLTNAP